MLIELATGEWIQQLHDDDYLLPDAGAAMLEAIQACRPGRAGSVVRCQDRRSEGSVTRERSFRQERYLEPREALRQLLRNSSFVRQPAIVVHRSAWNARACSTRVWVRPRDTDMWVRLFSRYGVRCLPPRPAPTRSTRAPPRRNVESGHHPGAREIFDRAVAMAVGARAHDSAMASRLVHQFILAGAYRRLRVGRMAEGRDVLRCSSFPKSAGSGISAKWLPVRAAFIAATAGARRKV